MSQNLQHLKDAVCHWIDSTTEEFFQLARKIFDEPELGFQEIKASQWLSDTLSKHGLALERELAGYKTAFRGTCRGASTRPTIALLCEYDALPEIGHGCGHNLIGTASAWAGSALANLDTTLPGTVQVIGAPGEETDGGKVYLVKAGCFAEVDAAMMFHPSVENRVLSSSLAIDALEVTFFGKTAHAAGSPYLGINALDAVILTFNGVNALRQHVKDDVRMHGIVSEGGKAANVIPDRAQARFYLRARDRKYLNEIVEKFKRICEGAALMTGATFEIRHFENSNDNMVANRIVGGIFTENLHKLGLQNIEPFVEGGGSTDMGNVSQVCPAIHAYMSIGGLELRGHSREFAAATITPVGLTAMQNAAKALAMTTLDLLYNPAELEKAKAELEWVKAGH